MDKLELCYRLGEIVMNEMDLDDIRKEIDKLRDDMYFLASICPFVLESDGFLRKCLRFGIVSTSGKCEDCKFRIAIQDLLPELCKRFGAEIEDIIMKGAKVKWQE